MGTLFGMSSQSYTLTLSLVDFFPTHVTEHIETVWLHSYSKLKSDYCGKKLFSNSSEYQPP